MSAPAGTLVSFSSGRIGVLDGTGGVWIYTESGTPVKWEPLIHGAPRPTGPAPALPVAR